MNTQKAVTTCVENDKNQIIRIRKCSKPTEKVKLIYDALQYKYAPFVRKKIRSEQKQTARKWKSWFSEV